ncbi:MULTISPECIES: hypothetical protein [Actinoalloteichus]|uniref:hypothetical protein n=1 Tax=Actinoalloteichus TaxID=65496 RepID=UPI001FE15ADE|nr:hypothetical protein [Actinoalloteichus spitiensis]
MADPILLIVRLLPGLVGETRRTCHLIPIYRHVPLPRALTAYCGHRFDVDTVEPLWRITGMPCNACLARSPGPNLELGGSR